MRREKTPLADILLWVALVMLLGTAPAHLWVAGLDMPLGGPNVYAGGLATLAAMASACLAYARVPDRAGAVESFQPVARVLAVGALLVIWAGCVYLATDTLPPRRLSQMSLGLGMLFTVFGCVTTARRAYALVFSIVVATFVSAVFGFGVAFWGDPYLTIWLRIADNVAGGSLGDVLTRKRLAGLGPDAIAFSYQVAAAAPLALALLLHGSPERTRFRGLLDAVTAFILVVMVTAMIVNATRSAVVGVLVGSVAISAAYVAGRRSLVRLAVVWCLIGGWIFVFFSPTLGLSRVVLPDEPHIALADPSVLEDSPRGSFEWKLAKAYEALLAAEAYEVNARLFGLADTTRTHMVVAALRYSLDHPVGTGAYFLSEDYLDPGLDERTKARVLIGGPHNQFLVVLVYYGLPGLVLLLAFYLQTVSAAVARLGSVAASRGERFAFLAPAVLGAMAAYGVNSLLHNNGPFVGDWYHFILVGLVFALPRILDNEAAMARGAR